MDAQSDPLADIFQTAKLTQEIIRLLDRQIIGPRPDDQDDEVFTESNLTFLKEHLQSQPS